LGFTYVSVVFTGLSNTLIDIKSQYLPTIKYVHTVCDKVILHSSYTEVLD